MLTLFRQNRLLCYSRLLGHQRTQRCFSGTSSRRADDTAESINVTFITPKGERVECSAKEGTTVLELAHANEVDLEGYVCVHCFF
jgi:hypothetical protein